MRSPPEAARPPADGTGDVIQPNGSPLLVGRAEAARLLGVSMRTVDALTSTGAIPSRMIRRRRMYALAELIAWIEADCPGAAP